MPGPIKTEAVVLRSMRYGEADRILHLYTPARGRVSAIAKGVRRARSRFGGRLEPFFRIQAELHEGRGELLTVTGAQTVAAHTRLRGDARAIDAAARACDAVGRLFETGEPHPGVFNLLCRQLGLLDAEAGVSGAGIAREAGVSGAGIAREAGVSGVEIAREAGLPGAGVSREAASLGFEPSAEVGAPGRAFTGGTASRSEAGAASRSGALCFRMKLLLAAGLAPQLGACASCGEADHLVGFSGAAGGVVCGACEAGSFAIDEEAHEFMIGALGRPLTDAPAASERALAQVERAVAATLEHHAHLRLMPAVAAA